MQYNTVIMQPRWLYYQYCFILHPLSIFHILAVAQMWHSLLEGFKMGENKTLFYIRALKLACCRVRITFRHTEWQPQEGIYGNDHSTWIAGEGKEGEVKSGQKQNRRLKNQKTLDKLNHHHIFRLKKLAKTIVLYFNEKLHFTVRFCILICIWLCIWINPNIIIWTWKLVTSASVNNTELLWTENTKLIIADFLSYFLSEKYSKINVPLNNLMQ